MISLHLGCRWELKRGWTMADGTPKTERSELLKIWNQSVLSPTPPQVKIQLGLKPLQKRHGRRIPTPFIRMGNTVPEKTRSFSVQCHVIQSPSVALQLHLNILTNCLNTKIDTIYSSDHSYDTTPLRSRWTISNWFSSCQHPYIGTHSQGQHWKLLQLCKWCSDSSIQVYVAENWALFVVPK